MEAALRALLPKIVEGLSFDIHAYQGKKDLLRKLPSRLRGYAAWLPESMRIVVVVDRDYVPCRALKTRLERLAEDAGLVTRSKARGKRCTVVNRLAIEELEAWYFGDWEAVRAAYPRVPGTIPTHERYRNPDAVTGGTWEAFERILQKAGYFGVGLPKIEVARAVAAHMVPDRNRSRSFQVLRDALAEMVT